MSNLTARGHQHEGPLFVTLRHVALACAILGGLWTVGIMLMINTDVIGRGVFGLPVPAAAEIISASIVCIIFLQLPYCTIMGRNIRSDMLMGRLEKRSPRKAAAIDAFHHIIGTLMLLVLLSYIGPEVISAISEHETVGVYGVFIMPRWPFLLPVLIGCILTAACYALLTLGLIRKTLGNGTGTEI